MNSISKNNVDSTAVDIQYVALQFIILALFIAGPNLVRFELPKFTLWIGVGISLLGFILFIVAVLQLGKSLSLYPTPSPKSELITTGVFHHIRHPIYSGILLVLLGLAIIFGSLLKLIFFIVAVIFFYKKSSYEEKRLIDKYPEYKNYKTKTGRFFPK